MSVTLEMPDNNCWRQWNLIKEMLNFSIFRTFLNSLSKFHFSDAKKSFFVAPSEVWAFESPFESPNWLGLTFKFTVINDSLLFKPFEPIIVSHIETVKLHGMLHWTEIG